MTKDSTATDDAVGREESLTESGETLGGYLRRHRLSQHQELEEVARKIRIQPAILQAIEEDDHSALPAEVFTRGFIKSYSRHLGLDPDEAIQWHNRQITEKGRRREAKINVQEVLASEELAHPPDFRWGRIFSFLFLLVLLGAFGYLLLSAMDEEGPGPEPAIEAPAPRIEPEPAPPVIEPEAQEGEDVPGAETQADEAGMPANEQAGMPGEPSPSGSGSLILVPEKMKTSQGSSPAPAAAGKYVLAAEFSAPTWVRIQLDGKNAQTFSYKRGDSPVWLADRQISLSVGNAGAVSLSLNDKRLAPIGKPGQSVHVAFPRE